MIYMTYEYNDVRVPHQVYTYTISGDPEILEWIESNDCLAPRTSHTSGVGSRWIVRASEASRGKPLGGGVQGERLVPAPPSSRAARSSSRTRDRPGGERGGLSS